MVIIIRFQKILKFIQIFGAFMQLVPDYRIEKLFIGTVFQDVFVNFQDLLFAMNTVFEQHFFIPL
jgi:hypothetical protein